MAGLGLNIPVPAKTNSLVHWSSNSPSACVWRLINGQCNCRRKATAASRLKRICKLKRVCFLRVSTGSDSGSGIAAMVSRRNTSHKMETNAASSSGNCSVSPVEIETQPLVQNASTGFGHYLNKASKWLVSVVFAGIVLWKHDLEVLWAVVGAILNVANSKVLKHLLNHERPQSAAGLKVDPGMPSSHAQSFGYASVYAATSLIGWQGLNIFSIAIGILILIFGAYLAWLRVHQGLHTFDQVLVGASLGSVSALFWYWLWKSIVANAVATYLWVELTLICISVLSCVGFVFNVVQNWTFHDL